MGRLFTTLERPSPLQLQEFLCLPVQFMAAPQPGRRRVREDLQIQSPSFWPITTTQSSFGRER